LEHSAVHHPVRATPTARNLLHANSGWNLSQNELALVARIDSVVRDFHELMCPIVIHKKLSGRELIYQLGRGRLMLRFFDPQSMSYAARDLVDIRSLPINAGALRALPDSGARWGWNVVAFRPESQPCTWNLTTSKSMSLTTAVSRPVALNCASLFSKLRSEPSNAKQIRLFQSKEIQDEDLIKILHVATGTATV
jgi:hypothetical protein